MRPRLDSLLILLGSVLSIVALFLTWLERPGGFGRDGWSSVSTSSLWLIAVLLLAVWQALELLGLRERSPSADLLAGMGAAFASLLMLAWLSDLLIVGVRSFGFSAFHEGFFLAALAALSLLEGGLSLLRGHRRSVLARVRDEPSLRRPASMLAVASLAYAVVLYLPWLEDGTTHEQAREGLFRLYRSGWYESPTSGAVAMAVLLWAIARGTGLIRLRRQLLGDAVLALLVAFLAAISIADMRLSNASATAYGIWFGVAVAVALVLVAFEALAADQRSTGGSLTPRRALAWIRRRGPVT